MTGIIWACAATFIAACVPILAKVGTKKDRPGAGGKHCRDCFMCVYIFFFTGKII